MVNWSQYLFQCKLDSSFSNYNVIIFTFHLYNHSIPWKNVTQKPCSMVQLGKKDGMGENKRRENKLKALVSSSSGARQSKLVVKSTGWLHHSALMVARHHYGTECLLDIFRGFSPQQTHHILHDSCITRKCDPFITRVPKLFL